MSYFFLLINSSFKNHRLEIVKKKKHSPRGLWDVFKVFILLNNRLKVKSFNYQKFYLLLSIYFVAVTVTVVVATDWVMKYH